MAFVRVVKRTKQVRIKRERPEAVLQKAVIAYLSAALPRNALATTFPMSGGANFLKGPSLASQGAVRGFPDIIILHEAKCYAIELKSTTGRLSPEQREVHAKLQDARVPVAVCRSVDDVRRFLVDDCGLWLRGVVQ